MADALTSAWQRAEATGDYSQIAGLLQGQTAGSLMSTYGLSNQDIAYINNMSGAGVAATPQEASELLWSTMLSDPRASYDDFAAAGRNIGVDLAGLESAYKDVGSRAYQQQYGVGPNEREAADALYYLSNGVGNLTSGMTALNDSQRGYNYDTQDIINAYRETFGRNPTQEEYVGAMATLGVENFDRNSLGQSGAYTAATVAALESDPYAGRYAGYNPYSLPADAANVSRNILGSQVQYISPITQRPVVSSFENGQLKLDQGLDALTPQQVESAIGLATATGGLTPEAFDAMSKRLSSAKTTDDLYAAFSQPRAVASLGAGGVQTGVGQNYDEAVSRGFGGVDMDALYKALYQDAAPYKMSDTLGTDPLKTLSTTNKQNLLNSTQLGMQQGLNLNPSLQDPTKMRNLGTFGAAGGERIGAGDANYKSSLIKSLRQSGDDYVSENTGVTKYGFLGSNAAAPTGGAPLNAGGALSPGVFAPDAASGQDVSDWNNYNTYRTNSLQAKTPYTSFEEWLTGGKVSGIPAPAPIEDPSIAYLAQQGSFG